MPFTMPKAKDLERLERLRADVQNMTKTALTRDLAKVVRQSQGTARASWKPEKIPRWWVEGSTVELSSGNIGRVLPFASKNTSWTVSAMSAALCAYYDARIYFEKHVRYIGGKSEASAAFEEEARNPYPPMHYERWENISDELSLSSADEKPPESGRKESNENLENFEPPTNDVDACKVASDNDSEAENDSKTNCNKHEQSILCENDAAADVETNHLDSERARARNNTGKSSPLTQTVQRKLAKRRNCLEESPESEMSDDVDWSLSDEKRKKRNSDEDSESDDEGNSPQRQNRKQKRSRSAEKSEISNIHDSDKEEVVRDVIAREERAIADPRSRKRKAVGSPPETVLGSHRELRDSQESVKRSRYNRSAAECSSNDSRNLRYMLSDAVNALATNRSKSSKAIKLKVLKIALEAATKTLDEELDNRRLKMEKTFAKAKKEILKFVRIAKMRLPGNIANFSMAEFEARGGNVDEVANALSWAQLEAANAAVSGSALPSTGTRDEQTRVASCRNAATRPPLAATVEVSETGVRRSRRNAAMASSVKTRMMIHETSGRRPRPVLASESVVYSSNGSPIDVSTIRRTRTQWGNDVTGMVAQLTKKSDLEQVERMLLQTQMKLKAAKE